MVYVKTKGKEERQKLISFLKEQGYRVDKDESRTPDEIEESNLPLEIDLTDKIYRMMGNATCAAAAVSSGKVITAEEFFYTTLA